jgi:hypothetical protein
LLEARQLPPGPDLKRALVAELMLYRLGLKSRSVWLRIEAT